MRRILSLVLLLLIVNFSSGCGFWKFYKSRGIAVTVIDQKTNKPITDAHVIYLASDIHDTNFKKGIVYEKTTDADGTISIPSEKEWEFFMIIPPIFPVPYHTVCIWKEGYSTFCYSGPQNRLETFIGYPEEVKKKLESIPKDFSSNKINDPRNLLGGTIKLIPLDEKLNKQ